MNDITRDSLPALGSAPSIALVNLRADTLSDTLEEALGEDIDNDLYSEVKNSLGQLFVIGQWIECAPGIIMLAKITYLLDRIEDFIVNNLAKE